MRKLPDHIHIKPATLEDLEQLIIIGQELFDYPVKEDRAREFLSDPRHHMIIAVDEKKIVGMVSGVHYVHPDKDPELFINEASVIESYQGQGIGQNLLRFIIEYAQRELECATAWVATENSNEVARKAYRAAGGKEDDSFIFIEFD
ncbi:MAG: GNAT family N-acetyltransferase [Marinoscillum sp.]